jgi:hypothetical protein
LKITKSQLKQIIQEELENVLNEQRRPFERNKEVKPEDTGDKTTDDFSVDPEKDEVKPQETDDHEIKPRELEEQTKVVDQTIKNHRLLVKQGIMAFVREPNEENQSALVTLLVDAVKSGATKRILAKKILQLVVKNAREALKLADKIKG